MKITVIEVVAAVTANLGDYNNTRPEVRLRAELEEGDDLDTSYAVLMDEARQKVHDEVDKALMELGMSPRYYDGTRYRVVGIDDFKAVLVFPTDCAISVITFRRAYPIISDFPLDHSVERAQLYAKNQSYEVFVLNDQAQINTLIESLKAAHEPTPMQSSPLDSF